MLYPIKFKPVYKSKVWGGDKISKIKADKKAPANCGESWEISAIEGDLSVVANGFLRGNNIEEIIEIYMGEILGDSVFDKFGYQFPLLIKIIEAKENLSVQVHPNDDIAAERHDSHGKNEIWYVLDSEPGSKLISGFSRDVSKDEFFESIENGSFEDLINQPETKSGEVYFIPAGRVHSLGAGNTIVEIQQTSDITYRVYDYGRVGRELHLDLAADVIDFKKTEFVKTVFSRNPDKSNKIISNQYFSVNMLPVMNTVVKDYYELDSFVVYFCINGKLSIKTIGNDDVILKKGETVLIPAAINTVTIIPSEYSELLEVFLEP
jgi:mannose-6-phosphate isomerase